MKERLTVEIEKIVYGGQGMGRADGKVIFVPFTAPGDRITANILKEKKNYLEGEIRTIKKPSPKRISPFCSVFGLCGGCHLQHLSYDDQISVKEEQLRSSLYHLSAKRYFEILPILRAPHDRGYRIRAQLKASIAGGRTMVGFHGIKSHQVVGICGCPLLHPLANKILQELYSRIERWKGKIQLRNVDILVSPEEEKGVIRLAGEGTCGSEVWQEMVQESSCLKGAQFQGKNRTAWGDTNLQFRLPSERSREPVKVKIAAESFFQVNPFQNMNLIRKIEEWAGLTGRENVLDLFCGAGNLTLPLARKAARVWGVDVDPTSVSAAEENARQNSLKNCSFQAATAQAGIFRILKEKNQVDLVVLDPPRAGAAEALEPIARLHPSKILYVSCEPPTLVRDLVRLGGLGYHLTRLQPLDMFPHTYHLEAIAELRSGSHLQLSTKPSPPPATNIDN